MCMCTRDRDARCPSIIRRTGPGVSSDRTLASLSDDTSPSAAPRNDDGFGSSVAELVELAGTLHAVGRLDSGRWSADCRATFDALRSISVLALMDAIDPHTRRTAVTAAVLGFVRTASAERLAVLLESTPARDAHPIVSALARAGLVHSIVAQRAHLLIDLRRDPG
jgi:hypothetical protein